MVPADQYQGVKVQRRLDSFGLDKPKHGVLAQTKETFCHPKKSAALGFLHPSMRRVLSHTSYCKYLVSVKYSLFNIAAFFAVCQSVSVAALKLNLS
jgi:hypothetical protein